MDDGNCKLAVDNEWLTEAQVLRRGLQDLFFSPADAFARWLDHVWRVRNLLNDFPFLINGGTKGLQVSALESLHALLVCRIESLLQVFGVGLDGMLVTRSFRSFNHMLNSAECR